MSSMDRELLARALEAEAGNQDALGMLAAGSVIMNRTMTPGYGGDLRGVILKPGQFSAFNSITGYAGGEQGQDIDNIRVSDTAYQVADALLSGNYQDPTGGATHFYNPGISNPSWGSKAGGNWMKIGDHVFGKADAGKSGQPIEVNKLPSIPEARRAAAIQFEEVDPRLRQRNAAIQAEAVNSFVPNATANNAGPSQNRQVQAGLLTGGAAQNMMGAGEAMQAEEPSKGFFDNDKYKNMAAVLAQGFAAMGNNPALQKFASQVAGQRTESQARNKTIEFLRKSGRDDLADAVESGSIGARDAAQVLFAQPKDDRTAAMQNYSEYQRLLAEQGKEAADQFLAMSKRGGNVVNVGGGQSSKGLDALDRKFAETYADISMSGLSDARSQAALINTILTKLEAGEELTGPLIGAQPDFVRVITNPDAQNAIDVVGSVVQRSLREILGGQFAQKEGELIVQRAYNPSLPPEQNAARLRALFAVLDQTAKNKLDMATYFENNNYSLRGYKGNRGVPSIADFEAAMDTAAPAPAAPATETLSDDGQSQNGPAGSKPTVIEFDDNGERKTIG